MLRTTVGSRDGRRQLSAAVQHMCASGAGSPSSLATPRWVNTCRVNKYRLEVCLPCSPPSILLGGYGGVERPARGADQLHLAPRLRRWRGEGRRNKLRVLDSSAEKGCLT